MASEEKLQQLEGRIKELEQSFGRPQREPVDISAEEMSVYLKVRDVIAADYGDFCGINDCFRCITNCRSQICRVCRRFCDVECICGPCNVGGFGGGVRDFTQFGG